MFNFIFCNFSSIKIAKELRAGVYEVTGLTCSAGVAPNRLLAKVFPTTHRMKYVTSIRIQVFAVRYCASIQFRCKINMDVSHVV